MSVQYTYVVIIYLNVKNFSRIFEVSTDLDKDQISIKHDKKLITIDSILKLKRIKVLKLRTLVDHMIGKKC